ncbi:alpha/beta hydrolase [Pseudomonas sp.]|uniref:alpha/beta hydrolase n=1 Tax=Pseudomonas sp. TaxID=306 RepID=UPI0025D9C4AB|nr:alpha/beta hydrolase [Pseudomonas sp.]
MIANIDAPAEDPAAIALYDGSVGSAADEVWTRLGSLRVVRNVSRPTLTPVLPEPGKGTGAAVIVAPGGGQVMLALEGEGLPAARALAERGFAAFVLKYRVVATPREVKDLQVYFGDLQQRSRQGEVLLENTRGNADAQAAVAMVRANAAKWGVDPRRVGLMGFSSGAQISRAASLSEKAEGRPDFVALIYGAMDAAQVPSTAPPLFAAIAMDDMTVRYPGFPIVQAWQRAARPVELHAYQAGGHGFGIGRKGTTTTLLLDQFTAWVAMNGLASATVK